MTSVKSFSADDLANQGGVNTAPRQDVLRVGVFTADGEGNLSGHAIATTDTNAGATWMISFDWTGRYTLNENGTGFFSIDVIQNQVCTDMTVEHSGETPHPVAVGGIPLAGNVACPEQNHEDYAFVFTARGGKRIEFIQTNNSGAGAKIFLTGTATAHDAFGRGRDQDDDEEDDEGDEDDD
jgi:hypothetical protein